MRLRTSVFATSLCALLASTTQAVEFGDWLKVDGFGTLGVYRADDPVAGARPDSRNPKFSLDGEARWDGDSLLSAQFTLNPQGKFRLVGQFISKDDVIKRFKPRVEWFYLAYDPTPSLSFKAGRMVLPAFLLSDTRNVNYAQTTARPVFAVYGMNNVSNIDGINATWSTALAGGDLQLEGAFGKSKVVVANGTVDVPDLTSAAVKWSKGPISLRAARSDFKVDLTFPATAAALSALASGRTGCSNCAALFAERLALTDVKGHLDSVAGTLQLGEATLQVDWAQRLSSSAALPDVRGYYLLGAYRLGEFTPFAVVGKQDVIEPALSLATSPAAPAAAAAANAAFGRFLQGLTGRKIWQVGVRWDFRENLALKLQFEQIRNHQETRIGQTGTVVYPSPPPVGSYTGPSWDGKLRMISLNLDFVF